MRRASNRRAFALYEVLLGLAIFAIGVIALGRAVGNCMNASALSTDDARVRQILSNRMAEIEATPGAPDKARTDKIESLAGTVELVQSALPANLQEAGNVELGGVIRVTLTAKWLRGGIGQSKKIAFYVYRAGA